MGCQRGHARRAPGGQGRAGSGQAAGRQRAGRAGRAGREGRTAGSERAGSGQGAGRLREAAGSGQRGRPRRGAGAVRVRGALCGAVVDDDFFFNHSSPSLAD